MDEVITRTINSIDQLLKTFSSSYSDNKSKLIGIRDLLNQLFVSNSPRNEWTQLFCRQLNRLMNYNKRFSENFWIDLHNDILYVFEGSNGTQGTGATWTRFLKRMALEGARMQRELQYRHSFGERKTLNQLFCDHHKVFEEYLQKCISLHSQIQVQDLIENFDDVPYKDCGLIETSSIRNYQNVLKEKLKRIGIPFDCSNRSLQRIDHRSSTYVDPYSTTSRSFSNFLPSIETRPTDTYQRTTIKTILESNRWVIILGDPGSAKSTLLRWITRIFAETAYSGDEEVTLEEFYDGAVRIPILIRIGEFAAWLDQNRNRTLIDYIGNHTWFSQPYTDNDNRNVLKELIDYGHALILLDGLDEIPDVGRRGEIVGLVRKFIDEYVSAPDFYSAFDDTMSYKSSDFQEIIETQPPCRPGGNQIIITSRIVGYQFYPISGPFIRHYSLPLMNHKEAHEFINRWMIQVEKGIYDILSNEGIKPNEERMKSLSNRRYKAVTSIFKNGSQLLKSTPSLLSLICTLIFQSPNEFHPKSRVEVYDHAVQSALRSWTTNGSNISKDLMTHFLINLSTYLHLNSPSGLIDTYDMKQLCSLVLREQGVSNNRTELRKYANKITLNLESNMGIVSEIGLEVFGFQHLSFQEYFVSQSLVKGSSIEAVAKRVLTCTINPRFRESLLMALGWISSKWSSDDYDTFCNLLMTPDKDYAIPLGPLLIFDAVNDLQRLPSISVIFKAINRLLDYHFNILSEIYLIRNLSKLPEDIIREWMQLRLKDKKCLSKFCQCLIITFDPDNRETQINSKSISLVIYQQLRSLHNISTAANFVVDQTLRRIMMSHRAPDYSFSDDLFLHFQSQNICASNVHPLILSVIIAVCGGINFKLENKTMTLCFSSKQMHRQSSITSSIIKYLANDQESHSIKVQLLIDQYENILLQSSPTDTSVDIVDTFIALICLKGLLEPFFYEKYHGYQALLLAVTRLRQIWFYLKQLYNYQPSVLNPIDSSIISEVESIMNVFFSQSAQFNDECLAFSFACAGALSKLNIVCSPVLSTRNLSLPDNLSRYLENQSEFSYFGSKRKLDEMVQNIHPMQMFQHEPYFLLTFIPQSLQKLYDCMIINPINKNDSLSLVLLLSQCLILLEDVNENEPNLYLAILILKSQFKQHMLENYVAVLLWENCLISNYKKEKYEELLRSMKNHVILSELFIEQSKDWEMMIEIDRQRICSAKNTQQNQDKDSRLFAASISLARLFQARFRSPGTRSIEQISLCATESEEVHLAIINILDPVLRIIAWSIILDMKDPLIFEVQRRDQLRCQMIDLLQSLLPDLPLLTATLLFVRYHSIRQLFLVPFQQMANVIADKLNENSNDPHSRSQEAAFIALKQLNNPELLRCLFKFTKQKENLSDLLQFNSSILFRYFTNTTSFHSLNTILLSLMYLTELAFDSQILQMYKNDSQQSRIPLLSELDHLWNDSSENKKIMTVKVATWITDYLQMSDKENLQEMIEDVSECVTIESKILPVIEKWLDYRMNKHLRFFAYYAALQLVAEGSNLPYLIDIINEMCQIEKQSRLLPLVERLFKSEFIDLSSLQQILVILHRNVNYSRFICGWINRQDILELILNLELERISSNVYGSSAVSTVPFLLMVYGCSRDLQLYLIDHIQTFINDESGFENTFKEEYVAVLVKWIIESSIWDNEKEKFSEKLFEYIWTLLHDQCSTHVQKAVVNGLNSVFIRYETFQNHVFVQDNAITHLEKIIYSFDKYPEDVVAVCLLAYGNCLCILQTSTVSRNISNEIEASLNNLFETSLSEIIAIRAAFCLLFAQQSFVTTNTVANLFRTKWTLTSGKEYNILLQNKLYRRRDYFIILPIETEVAEHIEAHSAQLFDTFVDDLHDYLYNKSNNTYLSDPSPDYVVIAYQVVQKNFNKFYKPIQKSVFGKEMWKEKLWRYLYHIKKASDAAEIVNLYAMDGVLTIELIEMWRWLTGMNECTSLPDFSCIKQVSNRSVIDKLFQLLHSVVYNKKFTFFNELLHVLDRLARSHVISSLELHQQFSVIVNDESPESNDINWNYRRHWFSSLFKHTCIEEVHYFLSREKLFSQSDIDEEFERTNQRLEKQSALFLRRNYFFAILHSHSPSFNQRPRESQNKENVR